MELEMFKECCKQCRHDKFKGTMTKWSVHKETIRTQKHIEHQDATVFLQPFFFYFSFLCYQ